VKNTLETSGEDVKNYTRNEWRRCENYTRNEWRRYEKYTPSRVYFSAEEREQSSSSPLVSSVVQELGVKWFANELNLEHDQEVKLEKIKYMMKKPNLMARDRVKLGTSSPLVSSVVFTSSTLVSSVVFTSSPLVSSVVFTSSPLVSSVLFPGFILL
jgi:hypothetical protein